MTNYQSKYFPKIDYYDDKADVLWNKQMNRIISERKLLTRNNENSSREMQNTFYKVSIVIIYNIIYIYANTTIG